jgi:hypothetical protein
MSRAAGRSRFASAADWPPWTDADTWELGPDPSDEDRRWAADHLNGDDCQTDEPTPLEVLELAADEAEAQDRLDRGIPLF